MRVLAIHRYFWPDSPPYAVMLRAICTHWAAAGHDVEVVSSTPSYKPGALVEAPATEVIEDVTVTRLRMRPDRGGPGRRPINMVRFSLLAAWRVLSGPRRDVVMCSTAPQVLLGWAVSLAARARGAAFVYHCMDLHPEIGRLSGDFAHPMVYRALMRLDRAACRRAVAIVVLSDDMRDALLARDPGLADRIVVLNNFDLPAYDQDAQASVEMGEAPQPESRRDEPVTIAFTGNLGRFQGLSQIVDAMLSETGLADLRLVLMGEGAAKPELEERVAAAPEARRGRVVLLPHGSSGAARELMRHADWGLVSLAPDVVRYAYPSKTATYLSEGLPVLAAVEPDSALARDVVGWGAGRLLTCHDREQLCSELARLVESRDQAAELSRGARAAWAREFDLGGRLRRWDDVLALVSRGREGR